MLFTLFAPTPLVVVTYIYTYIDNIAYARMFMVRRYLKNS